MLLNCGVGKDSRIPWTARRSNQSILKEISSGCSLEELMLMLKLKLLYFGHLMGRADSLEKTLVLGKIEVRKRRDKRGWDVWMHLWLNVHEFLQALGVGDSQEGWHAAVHGVTKELDTTEQLNIICMSPAFWISLPPSTPSHPLGFILKLINIKYY